MNLQRSRSFLSRRNLRWTLLISAALAISAVSGPLRPSKRSPTHVRVVGAIQEPAGAALASYPLEEAPSPTPTLSPTATIPSPSTPTPEAPTAPPTPTGTGGPQPTHAETRSTSSPSPKIEPTAIGTSTTTPTAEKNRARAPTPDITPSAPISRVLGLSTDGWPLVAYRFGSGPLHVAFIGGIHGGYEWNTILLAYQAIDHFSAHPEAVPASLSLFIVPNANPDGLARLVGHAGRFTPDELPANTFPGRFNGNDVDLNRNWDADWTPAGVWRDQEVDAGEAPFSEVETRVLRDFLTRPTMQAVVFWHSARPGVYSADCGEPYPASESLAAGYAKAGGYPLYEEFYDYSITGNATDWLACEGVPAIAVELNNHSDKDWPKNRAAMQAVMEDVASSDLPIPRLPDVD